MKRAREAAAHSVWLQEQVQTSIDDPRPSLDDEQARAQMAACRRTLLKKVGTTPADKATARPPR